MDVYRQCIGPGNFLEPGVSKNTIYIYKPRNKQTKNTGYFPLNILNTGCLIGILISWLVKSSAIIQHV